MEQDERLCQWAVAEVLGPKCRFVRKGETYLVRTALGVPLGNHLLVPEVACMATR